MRDEGGFFWSIVFVVALVVMLAMTPSACTERDETRRTLDGAGYSDIETGNYAWFACGKDDTFATRFTATNPAGKRVSGVVCCGFLKNCTVRF